MDWIHGITTSRDHTFLEYSIINEATPTAQARDLSIIALLMLRFALRKGCRVRGAVGPPTTREVVTQMVMTQTQSHAHTQAWTRACRGYTTTPALHNNNNNNSSSSTTTNNNDNSNAQESDVPGMLNDGTLDPLTQVGVCV